VELKEMKYVLYFTVYFLTISNAFANTVKTAPEQLDVLACLGTEPYWSLELNEGNVIYKDLEENTTHYEINNIFPSQNHNNRWFVIAMEASQSPLYMTLNKSNQCSDDMSDFKYQYDISILMNNQYFSGCCNQIK
jgi:uncharacterized membrane protein